MKITFQGAARTTTGSMHILDIGEHRILLDCGLYQGKRKEAFERNRNLPFDPAGIDTVILSHAHIDHSGNLPTLVRRGFKGDILTTPATKDLCDIMLRDSAFLQKKDVEYVNRKRLAQGKNPFEPLYIPEDIDPTMDRFKGLPMGMPVEVAPGLKLTFEDAGHILGSAVVILDIDTPQGEKRLMFTGDMGRYDMPILRDPHVVTGVDALITESTYGNRFHPPKADVKGRLKGFIDDIYQQRAKLIVPSFSVGRTQQLVYFLNELHNEGRIPPVPIFVDSPLSTKATGVHDDHHECYNDDALEYMKGGDNPFRFQGLRYVVETEGSKALNRMPGPAVIIASSGMCEGGRILHHLRHGLGDPRNIILFVGYQAEHTLGRRIIEHKEPIRIYGEEYKVEARIHTINALSAHADRTELLRYFDAMGPIGRAFVVHGELEQSEALAAALKERNLPVVDIPEPGQSFTLFE